MRSLWLFLFLQSVSGQAGFGRSYMGNSRLCHQWNCINQKLNLTDSLPTKETYVNVLRGLLPSGEWQDVVERTVKKCVDDRPRKFSNACPGQAMMHCVVDQLIANCPDNSWNASDGCGKLGSIAGVSYMFSQSRYLDFEKNLPTDRRPATFLKSYFGTKCCNLPQLFNDSVMRECGFNKTITYYDLPVQRHTPLGAVRTSNMVYRSTVNSMAAMHTVDLDDEDHDPLNCCDISEFIQPSWRSECNFHLHWNTTNRLTIEEAVQPTTTTTTVPPTPLTMMDVKIVPQSCEIENCIFQKLNISTESGFVSTNAYIRLLENLTQSQPEWSRAKARVISKCLQRPITDYEADCAINKILACTFDVLTETCPHAPDVDLCKHSTTVRNGITCQISSSKTRPKSRRQLCALPTLVPSDVVSACGAAAPWRLEYVAPPATKPPLSRWISSVACEGLTESTTCILNKMDVLNKYGFMDHFKMKNRIREFSQGVWANYDVYNSAFTSVPMYKDYCSSTKKLLNVVDYMLMTCPQSKRKSTWHCKKMMREIIYSLDAKESLDTTWSIDNYEHVYLPKKSVVPVHMFLKSNPPYDFGFLNSKNAPPVIVKPVPRKEKPLVLLPVYQRPASNPYAINSVNNDGVLRG